MDYLPAVSCALSFPFCLLYFKMDVYHYLPSPVVAQVLSLFRGSSNQALVIDQTLQRTGGSLSCVCNNCHYYRQNDQA